MAYENLKTAIKQAIKQNGNQEITGNLLQSTLLNIVNILGEGATFAGVATPTTDPGTPEGNVFYLASEAGEYANFKLTIPYLCICIIYNKNSKWEKYTFFKILNSTRGYDTTSTVSQSAIHRVMSESVYDDSEADFNIGDPEGNVIATFSGGHIKTKNFDSSKVTESAYDDTSLEKFKGKTLGILADSISTFKGWLPSDIPGYDGATYAYYFPAGNVTKVEYCWWHIVAKYLGIEEKNISNCAWSGSTVSGSNSQTNASAGCSDKRIADLRLRINKSPDIIICFISCNDWGLGISIGDYSVENKPSQSNTFREAYALMLYKLKKAYPFSRIFCCTNLDDRARDRVDDFPSNNKHGISTFSWNKNIIEIAKAFGCEVIDLHSCGIDFFNVINYTVDEGLHPNIEGHKLIASKVISELKLKY